ncbi:MAG: hypothetical protein AABY68_06610 [Pseudomonadota bacterium]
MKKPPQAATTSLADVAGCLQSEPKHTKPLSLADMDNAIAKALQQEHARIQAPKPRTN